MVTQQRFRHWAAAGVTGADEDDVHEAEYSENGEGSIDCHPDSSRSEEEGAEVTFVPHGSSGPATPDSSDLSNGAF